MAVTGVSWLYLFYMAWGMANMDQPAAQPFMLGVMNLVWIVVLRRARTSSVRSGARGDEPQQGTE